MSPVERFRTQIEAPAEAEEDTLDLVRYWRSISRNKWRILLLVVAVGVLAVLYANSLPPVYRGTATIMIEAQKPKLVSIEEVYNAAGMNREFYQTQVEILKSREMAAKLARRMKLDGHPMFDPRQQQQPWWSELLPDGFLPASPAAAASRPADEQRAVGALQGGLQAQVVRNSQLIRISFQSLDRKLAAAVPNELADLYIDADLEARMKMTEKAMSFLNTQSGELKKKLADSEQSLQAFRERERILDTKGLSQSGVTRQLEDLSRALLDARARRAEAENMYNQVNGALKAGSDAALESLPAIQKHPLVQRFREAEVESEKRLNEANKRYGPEHPRLVAAETDMKSARENLRRQIQAVAQTVSREFENARANEAGLERAVAAARTEIQALNRKEFQLASLERDVATNRQLYEMFIQRFKETNIQNDMHTTIARVIDPAVEPQGAVGPNQRLIIGLSIVAALLLGISLALLVERLDNTVKSSFELESKLGLPSLGVVQRTKAGRGQHLERLFLEDAQTSFAEAIRTIRSGVMLSALDNPKKIVLVTSSLPREGKTTIAANLSFALGQIKKTLLIDADMRRPRIGQALAGQQVMMGLSELCTGEAALEQCIYPVANTQVHVLPAGKIPPNPQELLASHRFAEIVRQLSERFDVIVIDSPPVQLVSDALVLSKVATEVVYLIKADETPYPLARQGIRKLRRASAPLVGAVLNELDVVKADRYYGEYSGYGKRYYARKYGYGYTGKR
jgi:polysaccharide biosynthesis transport protein